VSFLVNQEDMPSGVNQHRFIVPKGRLLARQNHGEAHIQVDARRLGNGLGGSQKRGFIFLWEPGGMPRIGKAPAGSDH
jgi:hypothetical protein